MDGITLNHEQGLYVIPCGKGYTCLGFDVCKEWTIKRAQWAVVALPEPMPYASLEAYALYEHVSEQVRVKAALTHSRCPVDLTPELIGLEGKRVEVVDCYGETRRFYVGKSTGWIPIHLEIEQRNSSSGMAVMGTPFKSVRVVGTRTR